MSYPLDHKRRRTADEYPAQQVYRPGGPPAAPYGSEYAPHQQYGASQYGGSQYAAPGQYDGYGSAPPGGPPGPQGHYGGGGGMMMGGPGPGAVGMMVGYGGERGSFPCCKLRGLPFDVTEDDIRIFVVGMMLPWVLKALCALPANVPPPRSSPAPIQCPSLDLCLKTLCVPRKNSKRGRHLIPSPHALTTTRGLSQLTSSCASATVASLEKPLC